MTPTQIRQRRRDLNMSPQQFGDRLGLTEKGARITVWRWENGKTTPDPQVIMLMQKLRPLAPKTK